MKKPLSTALYLIPVILFIAAIALPVALVNHGSSPFTSPEEMPEGVYFTLKKGKAIVELGQTGAMEICAADRVIATAGLKVSAVNTVTGEDVVNEDSEPYPIFEFTSERNWLVLADIFVKDTGSYEISVYDASGEALEGEFFVTGLYTKSIIYIIGAVLCFLLLGIIGLISLISVAII